MTGVIRKAESRDIAPMAYLDELCFSLPWSEQAFLQEIQGNELAFYIVAEQEGRIIGYAGLWGILEEGHITNIAVHPEFRRKGLGKLLLTALMEHTQDQGITKYTLEVRRSNFGAIALYHQMGFQTVGLRARYYEDNDEDALIMWRVMKPSQAAHSEI